MSPSIIKDIPKKHFSRISVIVIKKPGAGPTHLRVASALDVANAALYLASDEAAFISGVCIEVDGARCV